MAGAVKSITCSSGLVTAASGGTIDTADITADAVTFAKVQNIATSRLLGRYTASSGDIEEISLGTTFSVSGGTLNWASVANANYIFASPNGATGTPTFRAMVEADLPSAIAYTKIASVTGKTLLGNYSAGTAAATCIALADGLRFDGSNNLSMWHSVPASSGASGTAGQIAFDSDYLYICIEPNTWARVAVATW